MTKLRYLGRDEEGEPLWSMAATAIGSNKHNGRSRWQQEDMSFKDKVKEGFAKSEAKGWAQAYSKQAVKKIWGF